jgi:hypothetical protein
MTCLDRHRGTLKCISNTFATGVKRRWVVSITLRPLYLRTRPCTRCKEARWDSGSFWKARKISYPPASSPRTVLFQARRYTVWCIPADAIPSAVSRQTLYRLMYPGSRKIIYWCLLSITEFQRFQIHRIVVIVNAYILDRLMSFLTITI